MSVTFAEYTGVLNILRKHFAKMHRFDREIEGVFHEMRWNARFNAKFRDDTYGELRSILAFVEEE